MQLARWLALIASCVSAELVLVVILRRLTRWARDQRETTLWAVWVSSTIGLGLLALLSVLAIGTPRWSYFLVALPPGLTLTAWLIRAILASNRIASPSAAPPGLDRLERVGSLTAIAFWAVLAIGTAAAGNYRTLSRVFLGAAAGLVIVYLSIHVSIFLRRRRPAA
jgi:hypothetical protein